MRRVASGRAYSGGTGAVSSTNKRFLIAYLSLVAFPIAGLLGVLRHGRALIPPASVEGVWKMQIDPARLATLPCNKLLNLASDPAMTISQSGEKFTLSFTNSTGAIASGVIEGTKLSASLQAPNTRSDDDCGRDRLLSFAGTVDPNSNPRSLQATLTLSDCPSCAAVEFKAVREPQPGSKGNH
jgi:hypothetical protein